MKGFDALQQVGERHYLTGLGRWLSRRGNNSYLNPSGGLDGTPFEWGTGGGLGVRPPSLPGMKEPAVSPLPLEAEKLGGTQQPVKGGQVDSSDQYECNCEDCRRYIEDHCDFDETFGWLDFCCNYKEGDVVPCYFNVDPCIAAGQSYYCGLLVCGYVSASGQSTAENNDCACSWLTITSPSETALQHAWEMCGYCTSHANCNYADCNPWIHLDLASIFKGCVSEGFCPGDIGNPAQAIIPISPNICCPGYNLTDYLDEVTDRLSAGCQWVAKLLFGDVGKDLSGSCCTCMMNKLAERIYSQCQNMHPCD
jgi:hypothetical protein